MGVAAALLVVALLVGVACARARARRRPVVGSELEPRRPRPIAFCPRCGAPWFVNTGFCGGCGR